MMQKIGQAIYNLRKERNITQTQLAEFLFVTPQTVSKWEVGNGSPDISLIPEIAFFFHVSIDDLFGVTQMDQLENSVLRYSVLRDTASFSDAMKSLECGKESSDCIRNETDLVKFRALKAHLYLQSSRDAIEKALAEIREAILLAEEHSSIEAEWKIPLELQTYQLRLMKGEYREVCRECRENFESAVSPETLYIYFEILLILQDYEQIDYLCKNDMNVMKVMKHPTEQNLKVWLQYICAGISLGNKEEAKQMMDSIAVMCDPQQRFDLLMLVAEQLTDPADAAELQDIREQLYDLLKQLDYNEYIKREKLRQIKEKTRVNKTT